MARNDETVTPDDSDDVPTQRRESDPKTSEYPEITSGPADAAPTSGSGWSPKIGDRIDPRDRPDRDAPVIVPVKAGGGAMRGLFWLVATIGLIVALVLGAKTVGLFPDLKNPFAKEQTDRSGPALLKSVQDLSQYVAAEGNFEVIVDVQKDRKYIPDFLLNERILFVAAGSVEVYVDFAGIGQGAVKESEDRRTVEITLPAPQLRPVRINNDRSYVYQEDRGLFNRLADAFKSDPNRLQEVYKLAEEKIGAAAKEAGLSKRAEENTRKMLQQFLGALGYTSVTVNFPAS
ncbi:DUF4230 domain-containing protein [Dactylosporangium sp. NBC_01737]|uniref:DUF4230 domain-containing protein n=1 Tax=Dactylosporangium sp. NBC_01737 TaxID=2975959 RepID=UPI002E12DF87|nr:DUF4230 domain-containing protein [Dactylosporangium sp. NBC_01737]